MNRLTQDIIHYTKLSAPWKGVQERIVVNHSIRTTTTDKMLYFKWRFTNRRAEMWNSVRGEADESWQGFQTALDIWAALRDQHGHGVKLWVAKATENNKHYVKGEIQHLSRIHESVSVLAYYPESELLSQWIMMEDWEETINYAPVDNKLYPMQWTWQNPKTSVVKEVKRGGW